MNKKLVIILISIVCLFVLPVFIHAASLYFSPSSGSYTTGEQFSVKVLVSSTNVKMNAIGADISFSPKNLEIISISETLSFVDVWGEEPNFSNDTGQISFEGLILDGYQGLSGEIVTLIFRAKDPGKTAVRFSSGSILAYDGLGTNVLSGFQDANFILKGKPVPTEIPEDIPEAPEQLFDISIRVEEEIVADISDLEAVIVFESFGKVPTAVDLTYTIVNDQEQIVFKDMETVSVETERVIRKRFDNLSLLSGNYTLVVKTQYNIDVIDEFKIDFIVEKAKKEILFANIWFWIWLITLFVAIIIFFFFLSNYKKINNRLKNNESDAHHTY